MTDSVSDMIARVLDRVNRIGASNPGWTRPSYSAEETQAHEVIADEADRLGLQVFRDAGGNLFARLPGAKRRLPDLYSGSHLDTVPRGGAFDGVAGVAGAMALAAHFVERGETLPFDLVVSVIRAEESVWFPASYIGSRAALARLEEPELSICRADTGRTLADHMREQGGAPDAVISHRGLKPARFLEMHIEQGPVLHEAGHAFATVDGIRGSLRYRFARIEGAWGHSGGVPRRLRSDTVFALADLIGMLDRDWAEIEAEGKDLAITIGRIDAATPNHAFAKVPGQVEFCLDLRSDSTALLEHMDTRLKGFAARIAQERGVRFDFSPQSRSRPARLDGEMRDALHAQAKARGLDVPTLASGGGHDAAAFADAGWQSAMVFLRNWNGSHTPEEGMDPKDLAEAVRCIAATLTENPMFAIPSNVEATPS